MKIYIMVDMEGISGISSSHYISSSKNRPDLLAEARRLMALDVNACVEGCAKGGATEIIVKDCHGGGYNKSRAAIDPRADFIDGDTPRQRFADLDGAVGLILLGYHAKAGSIGAVLEHTMSSAGFQHIWMNGRETGEIGIDAAIAAEHGVPVIMVSGDDKTCLEAEEWLPGVFTCQVKKGFSCQGARMPALEKTQELLRSVSRQAVERAGEIPRLKLQYPLSWKVEMVSRGRLPDNSAYQHLDARTYELRTDSVEQALFFNW